MRRLTTILIAVLLLSVSLAAQWRYLNYEQLTVAASSVGITATKIQPNGQGTNPLATVGACKLTTAQIRYRIDGPAPTSSTGVVVEIGDTIELNGTDVLQKFRAIRTGSTSGVLECQVGSK